MIPKHMKVNKTNNTPAKELVEAILAKSVPLLQKGVTTFDYCLVKGLFVSVEWRHFPLSRLFRRWYCITVSPESPPDAGYLLVQYHDFTRIYHPGVWEKVFR